MNGTAAASQKPTAVQIIAVLSSSAIALTLAFAIMWCAIWKIYIEPTMLMLIGTVLGGIGGALTTILVGRSLGQLNHPEAGDGEVTMTQTTQTVVKPKPEPPPIQTPVPVVVTNPATDPVPTVESHT